MLIASLIGLTYYYLLLKAVYLNLLARLINTNNFLNSTFSKPYNNNSSIPTAFIIKKRLILQIYKCILLIEQNNLLDIYNFTTSSEYI
jgi:hypothetical protein